MNPEIPEVLIHQFQRLQKRIRGVSAVGGLGLTACIGSLFIATCLILDILVDLPLPVRVSLLVGAAAITMISLALGVIRPSLKRASTLELAAFVESQFPEFDERLLSSVEMMHDQDSSASPLMKRWLYQETAQLTRKIDFAEAVDARKSVRRCWWGAGALMVLFIPTLFAGQAYGVLLSRFVNPWGNYERVQNLILTIENGDRTVPNKSDVEIKATVSWRLQPGEIPETAWLDWKTDSGQIDRRRLDWNQELESYLGTLSRVETGFDYFVSAGRSRTKTHRIDVAQRPEITALQIEVTPPGYTGLAAQLHDVVLGEIIAVEQSTWRVSATLNKPVVAAEILWLDGDIPKDAEFLDENVPVVSVTKFDLSADSQQANLNEVLSLQHPSGRYVLRLTDEHGLTSETSSIRRLTIVPDEAPLIDFADAENRPEAKPTDEIPVPVQAADDYGIAGLELHYEILNGKTTVDQGVQTVAADQLGLTEVLRDFSLDLNEFQLKAGMQIAIRARAVDERPVPEPNESWTATRLILIRDDAKPYGDQTLADRQQKVEEVIDSIKEELQKEEQKTEQLAERAQVDLKKENQWKDEQALAEVEDKIEQIQQQLEKLAAVFEQQQMMNKLAEQANQIAQNDLEQARQELEQAQQADLQNKPQQLAEAADKMEQAQQKLDQLQQKHQEISQLQRDLLELNRLASNTERLASNVQDLEDRQLQQPHDQQNLTPEQSRSKQEWEQDQRAAWENHQQLTDDLDNLMQRRPELTEAAQKALEQQLAEIGERAEKLAQQQQALAEHQQRQADEQGQANQDLQQQQQQLAEAAEAIKEEFQKQGLSPDANPAEAIQKASEELQAGDLQQAQAQQQSAQEQLQEMMQQLGDAAEAQAAKQQAQELQQKLQTLQQALSERQAQQAQAHQEAMQEVGDVNEMAQQQQQVADQAEQLQRAIQNLEPENKELNDAAEEFQKQAQDAAERTQEANPKAACEACQKAGNAASQLAQSLAGSQAPQSVKNAAQSMADQQQQLARAMETLANSPSGQQMLQDQQQQQLQQQAQQLAQELSETSQQIGEKPIDQEQKSQQAEQAQESAEQAARQMQQAQAESQQQNASEAAQQAQKAAESLQQAAQQSKQSSGQQGPSQQQQAQNAQEESQEQGDQTQSGQQVQGKQGESGQQQQGQQQSGEGNVPQQVGKQVAQASRQLNQAGKMLEKLGEPTPAEQGQQDGQDPMGANSQQAQNGGDEGSQQPQSDSSQSPKSSSESLRQAAQAMRQAAQQMGVGQSSQSDQQSQQPGQQPGNSPSSESSDFGTDQLADLTELGIEVKGAGNRDWGQLPGELQTELLDSLQRKPSGEYSRLIRNYFEDISQSRAPKLEEQPSAKN